MTILEFAPSGELAEHVAGYWGLIVPADARENGTHPVPGDGTITLVSQQPARGSVRAALIGPRTEPLALPVGPGDCVWGIRFWPDAGGAVLGEDPRRLAGHFISPLTEPAWAVTLLESLAGCRNQESATRSADATLPGPVAAAPPLDEAIRLALRALIVTHGEMSIADVATGVGLSLRQLERRFLRAVGLNPIQYAKLRRMRGEALPHLGDTPLTWAGVVPALANVRP